MRREQSLLATTLAYSVQPIFWLSIDKASVDLVYALPADQRRHIVARMESRGGLHQLEYMSRLCMGNDQYELITL
jgi:hypothetical protein